MYEVDYDFDSSSTQCLLCGSQKLHHFEANAFDVDTPTAVSIIECRNCAFAWQYPLGRQESQSVTYFENSYADKGKTVSGYFNPERKIKIARLEVDFIDSLPGDNKSLLDVGAGAGIFAAVAGERQWHVTALDPALNVGGLEGSPGISTIKGTLDDIPDDQVFDEVTLWDVIEHVIAPISTIRNALRRIKKGGWIVIETGNYKSAARISGGVGHWIYQLDHRWYFSPDSMHKILMECGFSEFVFSEKVLRPGWSGTPQYDGPSRSGLLAGIVKNPISIADEITKYKDLKNAKQWDRAGLGIFALAARVPNA